MAETDFTLFYLPGSYYSLKVCVYRGTIPIIFVILPLKRKTKIAADDFFFYFYLSKKIRLDFSRESSD